ncbi:MAG: UvrD-helicase domain-containing protein, partial [Bacteroidota bacterium]
MKNQFKIYRSSAGSGKTFTLTKEYLKLVLFPPETSFSPDYYRHILAITFTRDAAREMKERILGALLDFQQAQPENDVLLEKILEEVTVELPPDEVRTQVRKRASLIHSTILHNYSDFAVSTIDAFNQRIVRAFGKDLNLPYNFAIQQDTDELVDSAVGQLFQRIGPKGDPNLSKVFREFSNHQTRQHKDWNIDRSVAEFSNYLMHEDKQALLQKIWLLDEQRFLDAQKQLKTFVQELRERVVILAERALQLIKEHGLTEKDFHFGKTGIVGYFRKHTDAAQLPIWEDGLSKSRVKDTIEDGKWGKGAIPEHLKTELREIFFEIEHIKVNNRDDYWAALHMQGDVFRLAVLKWLYEVVE